MRVNGMRSKFSFSAVILLAINQFVGRSGGLPERQKQDSHVYRKTGTLRSRHCVKRRSLRNCEKGMEFLPCDECEYEYSK